MESECASPFLSSESTKFSTYVLYIKCMSVLTTTPPPAPLPSCRYLSCDKNGILDAAASAVSPYEVFLPIPSQSRDSTFALQIASGDIERFLSFAEPPESDAGPPSSSSSSRRKIRLRGDADSLSFQTTTHVRMQARFKPAPPVSRERSAAVLGWTSRLELETAAGRKLDDEEVKVLRKARKEGNYHEALLDVRVKSKHDKFAS